MVYDKQDRLTTYNGQSFSCDADGNLTSGILNGTASAFSYDSENQLTQAVAVSYAYDAEDNRISATTASGSVQYASDNYSIYHL